MVLFVYQAVKIDASEVTVWYKMGTVAKKLHNYPLARLAFEQVCSSPVTSQHGHSSLVAKLCCRSSPQSHLVVVTAHQWPQLTTVTSCYSCSSPVANLCSHSSPVTSEHSHSSPVTSLHSHNSPVTSLHSHNSPVTSLHSHNLPLS